MENRQPLKIFIAFANEDRDVRDKLLRQMNLVKAREHWDIWASHEIMAGSAWSEEIKSRLEDSEIVILLMSESFFNSEYILEVELPAIIEKHWTGKSQLIPVIAKQCLWKDTHFGNYTILGNVQALPPGERPIISKGAWDNEDEPYVETVAGIKESVRQYKAKLAEQERLELIEKQKLEIDNRIPESDKKLGIATSKIFDAHTSKFKTEGIVRRFLKGSIYMITKKGEPEVKHIPVDDGHQAKINNSNIGICYEMKGGTGSDLGFPISDIEEAWEGNNSTKGLIQWFEGGSIYFTQRYGARILLNEKIRSKLWRLEERWKENKDSPKTGGILGFPITNEEKVKSKPGSEGYVQRFEGGYIIHWEFRTFAVYKGFYSLYQSIDCWNSELGFPSSDEDAIPSEVLGNTGSIQDFENGCMIWNDKSNLGFIIYGEIYKTWKSKRKEYGFPSNIRYIVENGSAQQDFERGTINETNQIEFD